ncbi:hypothetical protein AXF42_Ash010054 [Apostasia shenzhenica]|uniref:Uncharacterized protein n=1 Tax=Apostasia shenzhenica TaxID=1088818 RepID=A0A2I0ACP9_9ASPA|nr:hypothetical protein AXF42_Ash010054 [Apostasia shenzhenica]
MVSSEFSQQGKVDEEASSLLFSFPSQPPDIRNWFSSYAYESPDIWGNVDLLGADSEEITAERGGGEETNPPEVTLWSKQLLEHRESSKNQISESNSFIPDQKGEGKILSSNSLSTARNEGNQLTSSLNNEELPKQNSPQEHDKNGIKVEENGFVSTRKRSVSCIKEEKSGCKFFAAIGNRGRSSEEEEEAAAAAAAMPLNGRRQSPARRKPFVEKTNVRLADEEATMADVGRWRCPRKSKPYSGPPLKQLRLEHWVKISRFGPTVGYSFA